MLIKQTLPGLFSILLLASCAVKTPNKLVKENDVERIIKTLSSDEMQGRATFTPGIEKAAVFIENEFKSIGLQPLEGKNNFRQSFEMKRLKPQTLEVIIDGKLVPATAAVIISDKEALNLSQADKVEVLTIKSGESLMDRYRSIIRSEKSAFVLVDQVHADAFKRLKDFSSRARVVDDLNENTAIIFALGYNEATSFSVNFKNKIETLSLSNIVGMFPGKSKEKELVVFSGHYDHLGIVKSVEGDSIANGADDDATGITAVISLAKYYKKLNNNERTLIFVAFTAEEIGGFGSQYFSKQLNPDDVVAMFNIEMIGKDSKFGKNTAFVTGYEKSDFAEILQKNLENTQFNFYPDPYPAQKLFYRSDNATLAALGVPAHTISTDQIDTDKFYHTVNDEFETLDVSNIVSTIRAIALSSKSIIAGADTPKRIPKLDK
ncbi:M28 family metallopeptidase [Daejeonella oryzae]|uniref:M28 family metallopeptidase n=1 Tax=Daejeonella oryzae TaxID=1122943 RepID=UPI00040D49A3|nr:M20/M25/M40 family metallo-hydrolase [Daejeonella oryzae]